MFNKYNTYRYENDSNQRSSGTVRERCYRFIYDSLEWDYLSPLYIAQWGGEKDFKGLIFEDGQVLVPCVIKKLYARWNNLCCYEGKELMGIINLNTMQYTAPIFDAIDLEPESGMIMVIKDGKEGVPISF